MWIKVKDGSLLNLDKVKSINTGTSVDEYSKVKIHYIKYLIIEGEQLYEEFKEEAKRNERFNEIQKLLNINS